MSDLADLHADLVRRFVAALNERNPAALIDLVTDDITWHFPGENKMSGTHVGKTAVGAFLGAVAAGMGAPARLQLHGVTADDEHANEMTQITLERDGQTFTWWTLRAYHFRDGKISEIFATTDKQYMLDDLLGRRP